jgi:hypothetical protein
MVRPVIIVLFNLLLPTAVAFAELEKEAPVTPAEEQYIKAIDFLKRVPPDCSKAAEHFSRAAQLDQASYQGSLTLGDSCEAWAKKDWAKVIKKIDLSKSTNLEAMLRLADAYLFRGHECLAGRDPGAAEESYLLAESAYARLAKNLKEKVGPKGQYDGYFERLADRERNHLSQLKTALEKVNARLLYGLRPPGASARVRRAAVWDPTVGCGTLGRKPDDDAVGRVRSVGDMPPQAIGPILPGAYQIVISHPEIGQVQKNFDLQPGMSTVKLELRHRSFLGERVATDRIAENLTFYLGAAGNPRLAEFGGGEQFGFFRWDRVGLLFGLNIQGGGGWPRATGLGETITLERSFLGTLELLLGIQMASNVVGLIRTGIGYAYAHELRSTGSVRAADSHGFEYLGTLGVVFVPGRASVRRHLHGFELSAGVGGIPKRSGGFLGTDPVFGLALFRVHFVVGPPHLEAAGSQPDGTSLELR